MVDGQHYTTFRSLVVVLVGAFQQYSLILEVRHRSWDQPQVYEWLKELQIGFCNIDQPQVSYSIGLTNHVTSSVGYLRLHGRNASMWFQEGAGAAARYDYRYTTEEIDEILEVVQVISQRASATYLITNNHFRGQAAVNALELRFGLCHAPIPVPPPLLTAHPELEALTSM